MARDCLARLPFDHLFHTKRLIFRTLENSSEYTTFIRDIMVEDPATYAQSTSRLLAPLTADEVENDMAGLVKSGLLAVVICLRPLPPPRRMEQENGKQAQDDSCEKQENSGNSCRRMTRSAGATEEEQDLLPTAIGWLTLDSHTLTRHHRSCTLGIMLASAYQGQGYGTEAINWALDWAFRVAAMHAVRLSCFSFNERAARLYRRLGFVQEGVAREAYWFDFRWYDRILFSLLDREWAVMRGLVGSEG